MEKHYSLILLFFISLFNSQTLDVKINEINYYGDSNPKNLVKINGKIFFHAQNYKNTNNLYAYDLQSRKPELLLPFYTDLVNTFQLDVDGKLFFLNYTGSNWQFWNSDGTAEGTKKLVDFNSSVNQIREFIEYEGKFYLISGNDLWVSDGTQSGTFLLKTFNNVLTDGIGLNGLTPFKGKVYFGASDEPVNKELWSTDGTVAGTQKLKEIHPTFSSIASTFLGVVSGDYLYFGAMYGQDLYGLWKTDGTAEGTTMVKKMNLYALKGIAFQNKIFFSASEGTTGSEMWVSDGTEAGTHIVKDLAPGNASGFSIDDFLYNFNGQMYFTSKKASTPGSWNMEIWKTDGTADGTILVNRIDEYIDKSFLSSGRNNIIFTTTSSTAGYREFIFNKNGTITPITVSVFLGNQSFVDLNDNEMVFSVDDFNEYGTELFTYNRTDKTYKNLVDINSVSSADPSTFYVTDQGDLIFQAESKKYGNEFYRMNKKSYKPELIKDLNPQNGFSMNKGELLKIGNYLYLKNGSYGNSLYEIVRTNGTAEGTEKFPTQTGVNISTDDLFANLNDQSLIFTSNSYLPNAKLYRLDNGSQETQLIRELKLGQPFGNVLYKSISYNNELYFIVNENDKNVIYKTNGTSAGTFKVVAFNNSDSSDGNPKLLGVYNGKLLLSKNKKMYDDNSELWSYDSTTGNLTKVKDYYYKNNADGQFNAEDISDISYFEDKLYILTRYQNENELYIQQNGTESNFILGNKGYYKLNNLRCGDSTFLTSGYDDKNIYEIFKTDNTAEGTLSLQQNYDGIKDAKCIKGFVYYLNGNSNRIWRTNGNPQQNTTLDINVTNASQLTDEYPISRLLSDGDNLHFVGRTPSSGTELYSVTTELPVYLSTTDVNTNSTQIVKLLLYPNPASDFVKIKDASKLKTESFLIYDYSGKVMSEGKYTGENQNIDISKLNKGVYIIDVKTNSGRSYSQKLIKN